MLDMEQTSFQCSNILDLFGYSAQTTSSSSTYRICSLTVSNWQLTGGGLVNQCCYYICAINNNFGLKLSSWPWKWQTDRACVTSKVFGCVWNSFWMKWGSEISLGVMKEAIRSTPKSKRANPSAEGFGTAFGNTQWSLPDCDDFIKKKYWWI